MLRYDRGSECADPGHSLVMTQFSAQQQAQMDNRDETGRWKTRAHAEPDDPAGVLGVQDAGRQPGAADGRPVPGYTSRGAQALQRIGAHKPAIEAVEESTGEPAPVQQKGYGDMRAGLVSTLKQDLTMSYNDGAFSADGEIPDEEIAASELELGDDSSTRLDELTETFMSNNYTDLKAFADATDQDMHDLGADAYLSCSGGGVGFRDRINPMHVKDREVAQRLDDAASETFRSTFENAEIGDDGKLHIPR